MKRKLLSRLMALVFAVSLAMPAFAFDAGSTVFRAAPQTEYAKSFIAKCGVEQWFMDIAETALRSRGLSINTLASKSDLDVIQALTGYGVRSDGKLPPAIGEFGALKYLFFGGIGLTGAIPDEIYNCTNLATLDLSVNNLSGGISANAARLTKLKSLLLRNNQLTGAIPASLPALTNLDLSSNKLSGGIPATLPSSLLVLNLSDNSNLGGAIPGTLVALGSLRTLMLWNCGLTGAIPAEISSLSSLETLDISQNRLTGNVPDFTSMATLKEFAVSDNELTGSLPVSFPATLEVLDMARNQFRGSVPEVLSALTSLRVLDIDGNELSGAIPNIWSGMTRLEICWLRGNRFVSDLPESLMARFNSGTEVRVDDNYIAGQNAAKLSSNSANFIKDSTAKYQLKLYMPADAKSEKGKRIDVYDLFEVRRTDSGEAVNGGKLPPSGYEVVLKSVLENPAEWFTLTSDSSGIYVTLLRDFDKAYPLELELRMLPYAERETNTYVSVKLWSVMAASPTPPASSQGSADSDAAPAPSPEASAITETQIPYITGYSDGTVRPDANMTREEAVAVLWRITGEAAVNYSAEYSDVTSERWSAEAITWAFEREIMTGYSDGTFRPSAEITRAEFAAVLVRLNGFARIETDAFPDSIGHWANGYIGAAYANGLMNGYPEGGFKPNNPITRAEVMTVINRSMGIKSEAYGELQNPYSDLTSSHWAYRDVLAASAG